MPSTEPAPRSWCARIAEGLMLSALIAAPWPYGCAPDWARYALVAVIGLALVLRIVSTRRGLEASALWPTLLALPALAVLQYLTGQTAAPIRTAEAGVLLLAGLGAAAHFGACAMEGAAFYRLTGAVLASASLQAVFGAVQWSRGHDRIYGVTTPIVTMPFGSYVDHNHFAGLTAMGALLAVGLAEGQRARRGLSPGTLSAAGLALALAACCLASRSRGGLLALGAGLAVFVLLRVRTAQRRAGPGWRPVAAIVGLGLLAALLAVPKETRQHLASLFSGRPDSSLDYRVEVASATLRLVASRPLLGSGLGAYADALPAFKRRHGEVRTTHAESDVLEFAAEAGLAGIGAVLLLARAALRSFKAGLEHRAVGLRAGLRLGALAALSALAAHSLFDFNLRLPANAFVAMALLGLVTSQEPAGRGARWPARLGIGLAFALVSVLGAWRSAGAWTLARALEFEAPVLRLGALDRLVARHRSLDAALRERARVALQLAVGPTQLRAERLAAARRDLERALELRPRWAEAWIELAVVRSIEGDCTGAGLAAATALRFDPTHGDVVIAAAWAQSRCGQTVEAVDTLGRLLALDPSYWPRALAEGLSITRDPQTLLRLAGADPARRAELMERLRQAN